MKAGGSVLGAIAMVVLTAGGMGSVGFSFDAGPGAFARTDKPLADRLPRPVAPDTPIIEGIGSQADPVVRARSYFDAGTGMFCNGAGASRVCR